MIKFPGIATADILLPEDKVNLSKWSVIACDQYTSSPEYWNDVINYVGEAPSTLKLIQPEVFLNKIDENKINDTMKQYLDNKVLVNKVKDGFVVLERTTESGKRIGLVAALDLDCYDYKRNDMLVRATEGTVESRLPPRIQIRKNALIELPHIMVLIDDKDKTIIEKIYDNHKNKETLYDFDLMKNGGHLKGWKVDDETELKEISSALNKLNQKNEGFLYAVGDGNHSIAAAKKCWEAIKPTLSEAEKETHPARFVLMELVNIYCPALNFEPIHRILFDVRMDDLIISCRDYLKKHDMDLVSGNDFIFFDHNKEYKYSISNSGNKFFLSVLQDFLDEYVKTNNKEIDYIHGETDLKNLVNKGNNVGILLTGISKDTFFENIKKHGPYPRKTFSIGHADEKRFYLEARIIKDHE